MELDVCYDFGIFHSDYLARSADDRDKAIWTYVRKRKMCRCGTREEEWDPAQGGRLNAYFPTVRICPGCVALQRTQEEQAKDIRGAQVGLTRNPDEE